MADSEPRRDLRCADFAGAELRGEDLRSADLRGADLTEADLRGADLQSAIWSDTTCPDGTVTSTGWSP